MSGRKRKKSKRRGGLAEGKSRYAVPRFGAAWRKEILRGKRQLPGPETLPDGTVRHFLVMGQKGRVLLPASLRDALGLEEGGVITAWLKDGELRMHSCQHGLRKLQEENRKLAGGRSVVDELIAERRAAGKRGE